MTVRTELRRLEQPGSATTPLLSPASIRERAASYTSFLLQPPKQAPP